MRAVDPAGGVDLAAEAGGEGGVAGELGAKGLDGGEAAAAALPAEEDHAHAALAEAADQLVGAESPGVARLLRRHLRVHRPPPSARGSTSSVPTVRSRAGAALARQEDSRSPSGGGAG